MYSKRSRIGPAALSFVSTGLLAAAGLGALQSRPAPAPTSAKMGSPRQVADDLDALIQPRFVQNAGMFGLTRLIPVVNGHTVGYVGNFGTETLAEKTRLARANAARRDYTIAFLHCAHVPGHFVRPGVFQPSAQGQPVKLTALKPWLSTLIVTRNPTPAPTQTAQRMSPLPTGQDQLEARMQQAALTSLPALQQGHDAQATLADWTLVMRPVRASADTCVSCHVGSKRGDTLGVMVYAVSNKVNKA